MSFNQGGPQAARSGVQSRSATGDPSPDHENVEPLRGQSIQGTAAVERFGHGATLAMPGRLSAVLSVPRSWSEVSPAWMTAALSRRSPGAVVTAVRVEDVVDGTNRRARVRLWYEPGSSGLGPEVGPESVFVKREGRLVHRLALVALGALTAEARLAMSEVPLPIEHPCVYDAGIDLARLAAVVVMDDVTASGARPNQATAALSVAEARDGLEGLASLHGAFWERRLPGALGFLRPWRLGRAWAPVSAASLARGISRLRRLGPGLDLPRGVDALRLEREFRLSAILASAGPQTVLHGDPHPGNTYRLPGSRTGFYDWQLVRTGNWSHDVGYFMVSSLSVADRRVHERALLEGYLEALAATGVEPPDLPAAWESYRATPAFGLGTWMHTISAGSFQPPDICVSTIERFSAAYADLDTGRAVSRADRRAAADLVPGRPR